MRDNRGRRRSRRNLLAGLLISVAAIAVFGTALFMFERSTRQREEAGDTGGWDEESEEDAEIRLNIDDKVYTYSDHLETYLLIGTDHSSANPQAGKGHDGDLADFLVLLMINSDTGKYGLLQIDRDTITYVPILDENGEEIGQAQEQICTAHWYGLDEEQRCYNTLYTVTEILGGLPIDGYYCMNMENIPLLNHAVGGVTVTIEDDLSKINPEMVPGAVIHLTDEQAEKFVRARMYIGDGTNISRMRRQRQYMENLADQMQQNIREDSGYINDIYKQLRDVLETDMSDKDFSRIASKVHECGSIGILTLDGESKIGHELDDGEEHFEFYLDQASVAENLGKIVDLRDITEEVITEDEEMIIQEDVDTEDIEIVE